MRIAVVGPSYPFRGGIAHYTSLLCQNLMAKHDVKLFSLKRQYPSLLFPGRTQIDTSNVQIKVSGSEAVVDSVNPFSWLSTARRIKEWQPDLVIIQWWHPFFAPAFGTIAALCRRWSWVVFLCHNVLPHEQGGPMQALAKMALRKGDGFIVHSEEDLRDLQTLVRQPKVRKAAHPSYDVFKLDDADKDTGRSKLGLSGRVVLFFGLVRAYKGLNYLLEAMPKVRERIPDATLVVAGEFYDDKNKYIEQAKNLGIDDCVIIHDRYVPNEEVGSYFTASDVVVLPYVSATQSGIVQIAFGFNRPVITTDVGGLPEAVKDGITGIIVPSADSEALAEAIITFFEEGKGELFAQNIAQSRAEFSWDRMVETIESLSMEVIGC